MNKTFICIGLTLFTFVYLWTADAVVTVKVTDEQGKPVVGAKVIGGWSSPRPPGTGWGAGPDAVVKTFSNQNGMAKLSVNDVPVIRILKDKFYKNGLYDGSKEVEDGFKNPIFSLNRPEFTIVLQRKINPIPMYVRKIDKKQIPEKRTKIGFDLLIGDWIAPYGQGQDPDFEIWADWLVLGFRRYELYASVHWPKGGLKLESVPVHGRMQELRLGVKPPEGGYLGYWVEHSFSELQPSMGSQNGTASLLINDYWRIETREERENQNWYMKTSNRKSDQGAGFMYGKIHGGFSIWIDSASDLETMQDRKPSISFLYYLNPDGTRNVEWDMKHNLAGDKQLVPIEP
jgi:hypothetical protein